MAVQKKIGDIITMRGQIPENVNGKELQIFDGRFDTGYKILEFYVAPSDPTAANEIIAKLHTSSTTPSIAVWDWADVQEIAWASWGISTSGSGADFFLLDHDNMVIENLYLSSYNTVEAGSLNYYITLQKYKIDAWDGALNIVTNLSQGGPQ
jgi:hypothetical protein